jgi:hypothetical protein
MKAGPSSTYWQVMTASTTLKSDFGTTLALSHPVFLDKVTSLRGVKATKISGKVRSGTTSFKVTVWISQGAVPLPIQAHITAPNARITVTWSNWGESVNFPLPAATVPFPF